MYCFMFNCLKLDIRHVLNYVNIFHRAIVIANFKERINNNSNNNNNNNK